MANVISVIELMNRDRTIDGIKAFACIFVIIGHICGAFMFQNTVPQYQFLLDDNLIWILIQRVF